MQKPGSIVFPGFLMWQMLPEWIFPFRQKIAAHRSELQYKDIDTVC